MAKKTKRKSAKKKTFRRPKTIPITREQWLKHVILVSERSKNGQGGALDALFEHQIVRLKKELQELRAKNELRK